MKTNWMLSAVLFAVLLSGCAKTPEGEFFGKTEYYRNFLFKKYEAEKMEQTITLEFNDDARREISGDISLEVVEKDGSGKMKAAQGIIISKNGVPSRGNVLTVNVDESELVFGIEFSDAALKDRAFNGNHTLYLREKEPRKLDRIDYLELTNGFVVRKVTVMNPLGVLLSWILGVIAALLLIWRFLVRPVMFETFQVKTLYLVYPELMKSVKIKSAVKVICSKKKLSRSLFSTFFVGKTAFVQNEFWEQNVEIIPKDKKSVRVRAAKPFSVMPNGTVTIGAETEITNNNTNRVTKLKIN